MLSPGEWSVTLSAVQYGDNWRFHNVKCWHTLPTLSSHCCDLSFGSWANCKCCTILITLTATTDSEPQLVSSWCWYWHLVPYHCNQCLTHTFQPAILTNQWCCKWWHTKEYWLWVRFSNRGWNQVGPQAHESMDQWSPHTKTKTRSPKTVCNCNCFYWLQADAGLFISPEALTSTEHQSHQVHAQTTNLPLRNEQEDIDDLIFMPVILQTNVNLTKSTQNYSSPPVCWNLQPFVCEAFSLLDPDATGIFSSWAALAAFLASHIALDFSAVLAHFAVWVTCSNVAIL